MNVANQTPEQCVANGARFLDEKLPDWYNKINLDELHLSECTFCVLGQLFGHYYDGRRMLFENNTEIPMETQCQNYGFNIKYEDVDVDVDKNLYNYVTLTNLWKKEIEKRRLGIICL